MNLQKRLFTLLFALSSVVMCMWADKGVWVEQVDGTKQGFLFAEQPKITYSSAELVMTTSQLTATFPIADIKRLYFDDDVVNAIESAETDGGVQPVVRVTHAGIELSGFALGTKAQVYDMTGKMLKQLSINQNGRQTVSISDLPQGTYIIKIDKITLKIQAK